MPSIIPWRSPPSSRPGTPLAPRLHRDEDPEDDIILFMATKDMHIGQIKPSKPPPAPKSCLKKRDPPSSTRATVSFASSSNPRLEDISIYADSESETSLKRYRGRDLRASGGAESESNLKTYSESSLLSSPKTFLPIPWRLNPVSDYNYPILISVNPSTAVHPTTLHWSLIRYSPHMSRQCIRFDICLPPRDNIRDFYTGNHWAESNFVKLASKPALDEVRLLSPNLALHSVTLTVIDRC